MASHSNNPQHSVLTNVIGVLQRLQDSPQQLAREREQRYDESPPPYASGEITQPPSPASPPRVDEFHERWLKAEAHAKSIPPVQFKSQANQQGIWGDEWGPAWPDKSQPMTRSWPFRGSGPFCGTRDTSKVESRYGICWGHETSEHDPKPEPQPEPEPEPEPPMGLFGILVASRNAQSLRSPSGTSGVSLGLSQPEAHCSPSRGIPPYPQFLYQISKEREWIKDETDYKRPPGGAVVDLDALAYESVKSNWIKDGIWRPEWDLLPGDTWHHEEPDEDEEEAEAPAEDDSQPANNPRRPTLFGLAPLPGAANDRRPGPGEAQACGEAEARPTETSHPRRNIGEHSPLAESAVGSAVSTRSKRPRSPDAADDEPQRTPKRQRRSTRHDTRPADLDPENAKQQPRPRADRDIDDVLAQVDEYLSVPDLPRRRKPRPTHTSVSERYSTP
ncbi:hypothetical protein AK830_g48 [Neonectria ditissima]|uniref:Uncharacterized protein n=1 Tax=Neonectria ditissima TaxID=78410 RepID=A0A0N8H967_9HYPO|nr:hypothetical protein AK830_g48 [Neonectria ditissima]